MKKRGTILVENVIFIVLNLVFLSIIVLFLYSKMSDAAILEEKYAKKIALAIDAAKPGMKLTFNLHEIVDKAKDENYKGKVVSINGNIVTVQLNEGQGYSYSFFNDVSLTKNYLYVDEGNILNFEVEAYNEFN